MRWKSLIGQGVLLEGRQIPVASSTARGRWAVPWRGKPAMRLRGTLSGRSARGGLRAELAGAGGAPFVGGAGLFHGAFGRLDLVRGLGLDLFRRRADARGDQDVANRIGVAGATGQTEKRCREPQDDRIVVKTCFHGPPSQAAEPLRD